MQHLSFVLFQLDEARRYILDGRAQHLRLAFLLLDNAAEIQMDRRIKDDMQHEDFRERMRSSLLSIAARQTPLEPTLQALVDWTPLTRAEKLKLDRFYDEKIAYMIGRGGHLGPSLAAPLKHLHKYRNEAYHRAEIRPETIRTAALILLEINCQMLLTVYPESRMTSSREEYSWLEERFDIKPFSFPDKAGLQAVVDEIRSQLLPDVPAVANALAAHLQDRFAELEDSLDFIVENGGRSANKEEALRDSEYWAERRRASGQSQPPAAANSFVPKYSMPAIRAKEAEIPKVRSSASRVEAFASFAAIEQSLEPIEVCVNMIADEIDEAIQLAVDCARGK